MRYRRLQIAVLSVTLLLALVGCVDRTPVEFESTSWKKHRSIGMAYDLERRSLLASMTAAQVEALLGKPDRAERGTGVSAAEASTPQFKMMEYNLPRFWYFQVALESNHVIDAAVLEP